MFIRPLVILVCFTALIVHPCRAVKSICSVRDYGIPNHGDCIATFNQIPYATNPTSFEGEGVRLFSEPQNLLNPFDKVSNKYRPRPIIQLPKIWIYSMWIVNNHIDPIGYQHHKELICGRFLSDCLDELWQGRWSHYNSSIHGHLEIYSRSNRASDRQYESTASSGSLWRIC